jgi:hypothetical protein
MVQLLVDIMQLYDYVHSAELVYALNAQDIAAISTGAIRLLDEVATGKLPVRSTGGPTSICPTSRRMSRAPRWRSSSSQISPPRADRVVVNRPDFRSVLQARMELDEQEVFAGDA